jgi:MoxR-like ATPase
VEVRDYREVHERLLTRISSVLLGQEEVTQNALAALLSGGHILIEGVPGLGKTLLVRVLSKVLGCDFRRIQFTPDLMPSDVTGGNVWNAQRGSFDFHPGPVFSELLLADEINRAPAKTQSALLEAMQERSVTIDGKSRPLPKPFLVLATQNPIESQGTYPLPEAQLDRFLLKVNVSYPTLDVEKALLAACAGGFDSERLAVEPVIDRATLLAMQAVPETVEVSPAIIDYIARIVAATRSHRSIEVGASPRASIGLFRVARASAAADGRTFVVPDDVKGFARAVLRHRIVLHPDSGIEGLTADDVITSILAETSVPGAAH